MPDSACRNLSVDFIFLNQLEMMATKIVFCPDETIFKEFGAEGSVHFLSKGIVRRYKDLPDGRRQVLGFSIAGDLLAIPQSQICYSADAVGNVVVYRFSKTAFLRLMRASPQLMGSIAAFTHRELWFAHRQIPLLGKGNPEEKLMAWLLIWQQKSGQPLSSTMEISLPMKRKDIADYLNITTETASRALNRLAKKNVLMITPTGVRILDAEKVLALATNVDPSIARRRSNESSPLAHIFTKSRIFLPQSLTSSCHQGQSEY